MNSPSPNPHSARAESARRLARSGNLVAAENEYLQIPPSAVEYIEALNFIAMCASARGDRQRSIATLEKALELQPAQPVTLRNLGIAYSDDGRQKDAEAVLRKALAMAPELRSTGLYLGRTLERDARPDDALAAYFPTLVAAHRRGEWVNRETTPPGLLELVLHAIDYTREQRKALFLNALTACRAGFGPEAIRRIEESLLIYLDERPAGYGHAAQRPKFLYIPGLPVAPYLPLEQMPWLKELEDSSDRIRAELMSVLEAGEKAVIPFLDIPAGESPERYLNGRQPTPPAWDAFFFYRHGVRNDENCARCPETARILDSAPLARIPEHAPEVCFSILAPGTHILPHHGVTNARSVVHLPLIVPEECALRVAGEAHIWQEGRCVAFDDTYEHEAWNWSKSTRAVLILDTWNPFLSAQEQAAFSALVVEIGKFNRRCGLDVIS